MRPQKKEGTDFFELHVLPRFEQKDKKWLFKARTYAAALGEVMEEVTIHDVRKWCGPPGGSTDDRVMGAVFLKRDWEKIRTARVKRKRCHDRPVVYWAYRHQGTDPWRVELAGLRSGRNSSTLTRDGVEVEMDTGE